MNDKLRLDFYLSVGGELVKGDECYNVKNEEPNEFIGIVDSSSAFSGQFEFIGKGFGIYDREDRKNLVIASFAERENKGVQPVPDDFPVVVDYGRGLDDFHNKETGKSAEWRWVQLWEPDYEALLKMQAEHDKHNESIIKACDEANKKEGEMIYTQEMKDNGELPMVGMRCAVDFLDGNIHHADSTILFINENGFVFRDNDDGRESFNGTVNDGVVKFYPRKTPEQLELKEAQEKQIDDLIMEHLGIRVSAEKWELRNLFNDMQKNGQLAKIILPVKGGGNEKEK